MMISIIIPVKNESAALEKCLDSLLRQDFQKDYEIIVVDGMSQDDTAKVAANYASRDSRVRWVSNPERVTPAAFNRGIVAAKGEIIATVGAHWELDLNFLNNIYFAFQDKAVDCLGGRIVRRVKGDKGKAIEIARATTFGGKLSLRNQASIKRHMTTAENIAYIWRRKVFDVVGFFDVRFIKNQDNEFNLRTIKAGFKTLYYPELIFKYDAPDNFTKLYRQISGYAKYMPLLYWEHKRKAFLKMTIIFSFFFAGLLFFIFYCGASLFLKMLALGLGFYAAAVMLYALATAAKARQLSYWAAIVLTLMTVHAGVFCGGFQGIAKLFGAVGQSHD